MNTEEAYIQYLIMHIAYDFFVMGLEAAYYSPDDPELIFDQIENAFFKLNPIKKDKGGKNE